MATHRLYYDDSYLQNFEARVLSCDLAAPASTPAGTVQAWDVVLDATAFYPDSGGQPHDLGLLGDANVLGVRDEGEEIVHTVDREIPLGRVKGCIAWPRRFDHMQQHTGQHLLSAMFQERFGLPTVSFHLGDDLCTIDLRGPEPTAEILEGAQRAANRCIFEDRAVTIRYGTADQLAELGIRKKVDREGILRALEIEGADLQPCGGTHVRRTGEIGMILLRRASKIRQDWRVEFVCGGRAEKAANQDARLVRQVSDKLQCASGEVVEAVGRTIAEREEQFKALRETVQHLAVARAAALVAETKPAQDGVRTVVELLQGASAELLLPLATEIAKNEKTVALLAHAGNGQIVFAQHLGTGRDLQGVLKRVFERFPGKGGGTKDFVRAKLASAAEASDAIHWAQSLTAAERAESAPAN